MKERILKLCKRLDKFSLEDIVVIADDIQEQVLELLLLTLVHEKRLIQKNGIYFYNKNSFKNKSILNQSKFLQYHSIEDADYMIKGFCADLEVFKMIYILDFTKHSTTMFYNYFRSLIYETQKVELLKYFEQVPKLPQERVYMNTKVYLYLYDKKLFVSEKYLESKEAKKHTESERLEIKKIYLRSYRKVMNRSYTVKFHLHLTEELWKYGKSFKERYKILNQLFNISK